ncbi:MAG: hypothetical protein IJM58_09305 [Muribaculaceae bacterium]|nr:hypothetical protein [Muribaculaceae bacterium]
MNNSYFFKAVRWMRRHKKLVLFVIIMILIAILASCISGAGSSATLAVGMLIAGVEDGKHVVDGPLTTDLSREGSPDLLLNEIDQQIVKIRPMSTPIDQISRYAGSKHSGSMVVDYYSVDTKPTKTILTSDIEASEPSAGEESPTLVISTDNNDIFDPTDTILVQGIPGADSQGQSETKQDLMLYVLSRDSNGVTVMAVNGFTINGVPNCFPEVPSGTALVRMGRAASELDVQSPQFESLPKKSRNLCQIFKMQVEQSTLQRLANKEVGWTMSDQEEAAVYDMRLGMEKSFLFGAARQIWDPVKKEHVFFTGGIWDQAGKEYGLEMSVDLNVGKMVDLMREAFTGNAGSKRKILIGGSGLISRISKLDYTRVITAGQHVSKWGIDFTELRSKFGCLYLLLSEVFDEVGMEENGIIIDPEYIQKYTHIPFSTEQLNLKKSGVRNVDALVMTEASCLVLRYPKAHMRITTR